MGRQVLFHMHPDDCSLFTAFLTEHDPVIFVARDTASSAVESLADPCLEWKTVSVWNRALLTTLSRQYVDNAQDGPYYRVDDAQPILELTPSHLTEWEGNPGLLQGRIWGAFKSPDRRYAAWFDSISRWIRKNYTKNESLEGYVGPHAQAWCRRGGLLLPQFKPPASETWRKFFNAQLPTAKQ